jgi:hypothetical protein
VIKKKGRVEQHQAFHPCDSADIEALKRLASDICDDLEVFVQVQDRQAREFGGGSSDDQVGDRRCAAGDGRPGAAVAGAAVASRGCGESGLWRVGLWRVGLW